MTIKFGDLPIGARFWMGDPSLPWTKIAPEHGVQHYSWILSAVDTHGNKINVMDNEECEVEG